MTADSRSGAPDESGRLDHPDARIQVLVVDDEPAMRRLVSRLLIDEFDVDVVEADDGVAALDHVLTGSIDLVLLDLSMRVIAGLETLEALRRSRTYARIPIVLVTGQPDEASLRRAVALGVEGVIAKPFTPEAFRERLRPLIAARRAERARVPARGRQTVELTVSHRVIVMDSDAAFRAVAARHLKALCVVEEAENEFAALRQAQAHPPDVIVAGTTSELSSTDAFAARVRRLPQLAAVKLVAAVPRSTLAATLASTLYDGAIVRHLDDQAFEEGLQYAFVAETLAHLLLHPSSALVMDLFDRAASMLRRILMKDVSSHGAPPRPLSDPRWIVAWTEFECGHLLWELRMRTPLPLALELASRRLHVVLDRLTQEQPVEVVADLFDGQWSEFQAALLERGLPTTAEAADVEVRGTDGAYAPMDRATGSRRWLLASTGETVVVEVGPGRSLAHDNT